MPSGTQRFLLEGPSPNLRPAITETLVIAELMRSAAMKNYSAQNNQEPAPAILSGKAFDGTKALEHGHAFYLPRDLDDDGRIDHVDVFFPQPYEHAVFRAVAAITELWSPLLTLSRDDRLSITALGEAAPVASTVWRSSTPFVFDRHPHRKTVGDQRVFTGTAEEQIRRSLGHQRRAEPIAIEIFSEPLRHRQGSRTRLDMFRRVRKHDQTFPIVGATLTFAEPQRGPIALGRYAHFGLGQFVPQ